MLYDKRISLDPRLSEIAEMIGTCEKCADIGSDHGRLGAYLLQNHRAERVALTDISAPSLEKARRLVKLLGLENQADFCVCDGATGLPYAVDAAVIAGMGGETIAEIVEGSQGRLKGARLILQPNVASPQLRRRLNGCGWRITDERLVRDGRRIYLIIEACGGEQHLSDMEYEVGSLLLQKKPALMADYAAFRLRVARRALEGAQKGGDEACIAALKNEIAVWEEVEACL